MPRPLEPSLFVRRRAGRVDLILGNVVLLSSAALETERTFGALVPEGARRVVIGGLGFGATLRGALDAAKGAQIVVAEKVSALEPLLRGELADVGDPSALDDPRVDVDNGPDWASFRTNARLYSPAGLGVARAALKKGGLFAVWSGYPADWFLARLRAAGFTPSIVLLREKGVVRARAYVGVLDPSPA
jgi:spermidine synthase